MGKDKKQEWEKASDMLRQTLEPKQDCSCQPRVFYICPMHCKTSNNTCTPVEEAKCECECHLGNIKEWFVHCRSCEEAKKKQEDEIIIRCMNCGKLQPKKLDENGDLTITKDDFHECPEEQNTKPDWEERFLSNFGYLTESGEKELQTDIPYAEIVDFIRKLLAEEKQHLWEELVSDLSKMKRDIERESHLSSKYIAMGEAPALGYNKAITEIIDLIKSKK